MMAVTHPFPPVAGPESRILILGSFPSVASRAEGFSCGQPATFIRMELTR